MSFASAATITPKKPKASPSAGDADRTEGAGRNPFCKKYHRCLSHAARLNLKEVHCSRCFFRENQAGARETEDYLTSYLTLLRTIVRGDTWHESALSKKAVQDL